MAKKVKKFNRPTYIPKNWKSIVLAKRPAMDDLVDWCYSKYGHSLAEDPNGVWTTYLYNFNPKLGLTYGIAFKTRELKVEFIISCL